MNKNVILVKNPNPPTVEIDTVVSAAYIRFSHNKVVKTLSEDEPGIVVAIDLDASGEVVGVELIGVREFSIERLLEIARVEAPYMRGTPHYVQAGANELVEA